MIGTCHYPYTTWDICPEPDNLDSITVHLGTVQQCSVILLLQDSVICITRMAIHVYPFLLKQLAATSMTFAWPAQARYFTH